MAPKSGKPRTPARDTFQHTGGQYLYRHGPQDEAELFTAMGATMQPHLRDELVERGVRSGWLCIVAGGKVDCSQFARDYYDKAAGIVKVEYVGQEAATRDRFGAMTRPPLRKEYMPNSRGTRDIDPRFQRPAGFGFKNIGGGES
jgi:hypothetical protein